MFRESSHPSVAWSSQGASEHNIFDKHLPQEVESVRVEVQRGAIFKPPSPAGPGDPGANVRAYDIKVEPGGHARRSRAVVSRTARGSEVGLPPKENFADMQEDERFIFRQERVRRFKVDNHFPALVASPRIMPQWSASLSSHGYSKVNPSARHSLSPRALREAAALQLTRPTVSNSMKHTTKRHMETPRPWLVSGAAEAVELISDRKPALFDEKYDSPRVQEREEIDQAKERWVGDATMMPPNKAACQATCITTWPSLQSHIAAVRERGRAMNQSLQERYTAKRESFQKEQKLRGNLSSFEKRVEQLDRAAEEARKDMIRKETMQVKPVEGPMAGLKHLVNLKKL
mmetsp:Transcript_69779/g.204238  ORF Transcript_69779/g.204238 Transcript_69779/m.204238 type:complete len:345 (-) Transcript_69779:326-1360(-)